MKKQDLINELASAAGLTKKGADQVLDALQKVVTTALQEGDDVMLPGVGRLHVKARPERQGRNPKLKTTMTLPASRAVKFTASTVLKAAVR